MQIKTQFDQQQRNSEKLSNFLRHRDTSLTEVFPSNFSSSTGPYGDYNLQRLTTFTILS